MKPLVRFKTTVITDVLEPDQARAFMDLVHLVQQRTDQETVEIRDETGVAFGFLVLPVFRRIA